MARNCPSWGALYQAADLCSRFAIVAFEHPAVSQDAVGLRIELQEMYVVDHAEFMIAVFQCFDSVIKRLEA